MRRKGIGGVLAALATLLVAGSLAKAQAPGKPPALVNGQVITRAELDSAIQQLPPTPMQLTEDRRRQRDAEVLMALIDNALFTQFLAKNAPQATPAEVEQRMKELQTELTARKKTLQEYLAATGHTEATLRVYQGQHLQWEKYAREHVTDAEVQKYYLDYKDFFDGAMVKASHILILLPPTAAPAEKQKATTLLKELRAQIAAGKLDFAEAAKKYSQCPSAKDGGDLGFFARKWAMDENFARAAFALKVGEVSEVVQTDFGLHLIKAVDRKAGEPSDFNKIKDGVREMFVEELRQNILLQLRKAGKLEINLP
jgi:peptidyl-prolyl cis-trans isomerase C